MGVYIDMEMPKNCSECFVKSCKGRAKNKRLMVQRGENCPLVPVPPHGDLIDRREAIIDANERAYDFWLSDDEVNATIQFLKEQPTILEAEEGE